MIKDKQILMKNSSILFDLTNFKSNKFKVVLKNLGIRPKSQNMGDNGFYWKGNGILIITGNDPITGQYWAPDRRDPEKDYASYIGIEGKPELVARAVDLIHKYASYIKNETPGRRSYI